MQRGIMVLFWTVLTIKILAIGAIIYLAITATIQLSSECPDIAKCAGRAVKSFNDGMDGK